MNAKGKFPEGPISHLAGEPVAAVPRAVLLPSMVDAAAPAAPQGVPMVPRAMLLPSIVDAMIERQERRAADRQFTALRDALFDDPKVDPALSLANLFKLVTLACCKRFNKLCDAGSLSAVVEKNVNEGLPIFDEEIDQLLRAGTIIGKALRLARKRINASALVKPKPGGTNDIIYYIADAYMDVLHFMRAKDPMIAAMVAKNRWPTPDPHKVAKLPPREERPSAWADLVVEMVWNDPREKQALKAGGDIYEAIKQQAMRNRQGKLQRAFQARYKIRPNQFLKLSPKKMLEVKDHKMRGGSRIEALDAEKLEKVMAQAEKIEAMKPTPKELRRGLTEAILNCIRTPAPKASPM